VRDYGVQAACDAEVLARAGHETRVVVSADTDFGTLLAARRRRSPSVVLFRGGLSRRPEQQAALRLANLGAVQDDLQTGGIVVISRNESECGDRRSSPEPVLMVTDP
jgi:predicted nuclease of predicted toxin-antitoxin system